MTASSFPASRDARVLHGAGDVHHLQTRIVEFLHQMRRRHAEAGDESLRAAFDDDVGGTLQRLRNRREKIDAERLVGLVAHDLHLALDLVERASGHAERAEAAGVGNGCREFAVRNAAHAREHDGIFDAEHVAERGADGHGVFLVRSFRSSIHRTRDESKSAEALLRLARQA